MRIVLVTPTAFPSVRGNAVTVGRLLGGLRERGVRADALDLSRMPATALREALHGLAPELVHAFHAYRGAPAVIPFAREGGVPLVVSLTGTDANHDLFHADRRLTTIAALRAARALVVFHETIRTKVAREVPEVASKIEIIPQSVVLGGEPCPRAELVPRRPGEVRFLLPAGIRRVKNVLFSTTPLGVLAQRHPLRLLVAGPVIEGEEARRLVAALKGLDWATYLGEVPHAQIAALLDRVDVVINSSLSEGGMANSVLEAMSRAKPVLASDIEGNRSVIEDGVNGFLFADAAEFVRKAEWLIRDPTLRDRLGAAARETVMRLHRPEREIEGYIELYHRVLAR